MSLFYSCDYCGNRLEKNYLKKIEKQKFLEVVEVSDPDRKRHFCREECLVRYYKEKNRWI